MIALAYVVTILTSLALGGFIQDRFRRTSIVMYLIGGTLVLPILYPLNLWLYILNDDFPGLGLNHDGE
jgi:Kef-type K+ transport system membrane component KefB